MKTLVTGARGCLGIELCKRLDDPIKLCGDIRNPENISKETFDAVIHAAAVKRHCSPEEIESVNVYGTKTILDYCKIIKPKDIKLISSSEVYNNHPYGVSKLRMEQLSKTYDLPICCLRLPTLWGSKSSLLDTWLIQAKNGLPLNLYTFNGKTKKKFFMTLYEAADYCIFEKHKSIDWPICKVIDVEILATIISDKFGVNINRIETTGDHYEFLDKSYCSADFQSISYEDVDRILTSIGVYSNDKNK